MKERNVISGLSDIERETYNLILEREEVGIKEIKNKNPKMIGALGKLKSKGLIEFKRVYRQMNQFHKLGRKIVKIKGPKKLNAHETAEKSKHHDGQRLLQSA